jgi:hypothetical protein
MSGTLSLSNRQITVPPTQYVSSLDAGEHGILFYTSIEEMRNIHFAFVKSGLENNWGVIYAAPGSYSEELRNAMQNYGIDTKKYEEDGSLFIQKGEDIYKNPAKPDLDSFKTQSNDIINYFMNKEKKGLRIATDLTSFFLPHGLYVSLFDVEHLFQPRMDLPITLICAYDAAIIPAIRDLDITFFYKKINKKWRQFVDAHSFAIYVSKNKSITFTI